MKWEKNCVAALEGIKGEAVWLCEEGGLHRINDGLGASRVERRRGRERSS